MDGNLKLDDIDCIIEFLSCHSLFDIYSFGYERTGNIEITIFYKYGLFEVILTIQNTEKIKCSINVFDKKRFVGFLKKGYCVSIDDGWRFVSAQKKDIFDYVKSNCFLRLGEIDFSMIEIKGKNILIQQYYGDKIIWKHKCENNGHYLLDTLMLYICVCFLINIKGLRYKDDEKNSNSIIHTSLYYEKLIDAIRRFGYNEANRKNRYFCQQHKSANWQPMWDIYIFCMHLVVLKKNVACGKSLAILRVVFGRFMGWFYVICVV